MNEKVKETEEMIAKRRSRAIALMLTIVTVIGLALTGCGNSKEKVLIYSSGEDYKIEFLNQRLAQEFPEYDITVEYMSTGNHAAKLLSEGTATECDITHDLEYGYMEQLDEKGVFADLSAYDQSIYVEDAVQSDNYLVECRSGGAIIINTEVLKEKKLEKPTRYEDLLNPEYKGLISMPNPKASGTGYMFLKSLVNAWGEKEALEYFDKLTPNVLQYTSSGSGPVNALIQGEVAVGLGMTGQAVTQINEGAPLKILYFEEGSPYSMYGQAIIKGKEQRESVKKVFDFMINTFTAESAEKFFPEKIYKDKDFDVKNYPKNIVYSDMSNSGIDEKNKLLDAWKY